MTQTLQLNPLKSVLSETRFNVDNWSKVAQIMLDRFRLHVCHILIINRETLGLRFHVSAGERGDSALVESYLKHHVHDDHLLNHIIREGIGQFHAISTLPDKEQAFQSDHFQQWAAAQGLVDSAGCCLLSENNWLGLMICNRHADIGDFNQAELSAMNELYPSLVEAAQHSLSVTQPEESAIRLQSVVETFRIPVAILTEKGTVCAINQGMSQLIETVSDVAIEDGCVTLLDKQQEKLLYISLMMTAKQVEGYDVAPEDMLEVSPSLYFGFQPLLTGLPGDEGRFNGVMIFAVAKDLIRPVPADKLASVFGFSQKESQIAELLAQGLPTKSIADRQFVSVNTVKFHLKNIFQKTGCSSQMSLMNLINSIPFSR